MTLLEKRYGELLDDKGKGFIGHAVDGVERMRQLILDLLSYSRLGRPGAAREPVEMDTVLALARRNLSSAIAESGAVISVQGELPVVQGDGTRLAQLLQNLIGNAIKFRGEAREPVIMLRAEPAEGGWLMAVQDNGIGISAKDPERVFKIFQRLHTREEYEGTGIGLTLCRRIVESHGGKIWYETEEGVGTTFYFTLAAE